jgi:hypothetical protein
MAQQKPSKTTASKKQISTKTTIAKDIKAIGLTVRAYNDSVAMRIIPRNYEWWQKSKKAGFNIYRTRVIDGKPVGDRLKVNELPLMPISKDAYEQKKEQYQSLPMSQFLLSNNYFDKPDANIKEALQRENNQNFLYTLGVMSVIMEPRLAKLAGMSYTDKNVEAGNTYQYQITLANEAIYSNTETATVGSNYQLPLVNNLTGKSSGNTSLLEWFHWPYRGYISYYQVYRGLSPDGPFEKLSNEPILPFISNITNQSKISYVDTLAKLDRYYYYYVKGFNPFGDSTLPGNIIKVRSGKSLFEAPTITNIVVINNSKVKVEWNQSDEQTFKNTTGYLLERTQDPVNPKYERITTIPIKTTEYTDKKPLKSAFYRVLAIGIAGDTAYSMQKAVDLIDTTAPPSYQTH